MGVEDAKGLQKVKYIALTGPLKQNQLSQVGDKQCRTMEVTINSSGVESCRKTYVGNLQVKFCSQGWTFTGLRIDTSTRRLEVTYLVY